MHAQLIQIDEELPAPPVPAEVAHAPRRPELDALCTECPGAIEPERLQQYPFTNRCATCSARAAELYRSKAWMPAAP